MFAGTKGVRVPLPHLSQGLPNAKEADSAHEDAQFREASHV